MVQIRGNYRLCGIMEEVKMGGGTKGIHQRRGTGTKNTHARYDADIEKIRRIRCIHGDYSPSITYDFCCTKSFDTVSYRQTIKKLYNPAVFYGIIT